MIVFSSTSDAITKKTDGHQSMVTAMKAVVEGSSSVNKAAREYGVPRTTLQDRITGSWN